MKNVLYIFLLSILSTSSFGQKIKFTDSTNVWYYWNWSSAISIPPVPSMDQYTTDTMIRGIVYKKLNDIFFASGLPLGYVREDTIAQKVYAIAAIDPDYDTTEQLLYNYTLNVGDTFRSKHSVHYVSSIDSVLINAIWHKVWYLFPHSHDSSVMGLITNPYYVIEGVGSVNYPFFPLSPYTFETETDLSCFHNRGTTPALSHRVGLYFNNTTSCSLSFGLNSNTTTSHKNAELFPNPIDNTSKIVFPSSIQSGSVIIVNDLGQVVMTMSLLNKDEIQIGDKIKISGIYYYRVIDDQIGKAFSGMFVLN